MVLEPLPKRSRTVLARSSVSGDRNGLGSPCHLSTRGEVMKSTAITFHGDDTSAGRVSQKPRGTLVRAVLLVFLLSPWMAAPARAALTCPSGVGLVDPLIDDEPGQKDLDQLCDGQ